MEWSIAASELRKSLIFAESRISSKKSFEEYSVLALVHLAISIIVLGFAEPGGYLEDL